MENLARRHAVFTAALVIALMIASIAMSDQGMSKTPLVIEDQGSFFVSGTTVTAKGKYDSTHPFPSPDDGQTFQIDQMYIQYQIPPNKRNLPIVFVHGLGQTGKTWESTPDGREGFQSIFLRRGYAVYVVDFPKRGRAGFPSFNGPLGKLRSESLIPDLTSRMGNEDAFTIFRLGERYKTYFKNTAFPKAGLDQFLDQIVPYFDDNAAVISDALSALLEKTGPAILITHSQSSIIGWLTAVKSPNVKAIVSYEPAYYIFPEGNVPEIIPWYNGVKYPAGLGVAKEAFQRLTKMPIQIVWGDNIPDKPTPITGLDVWRIVSHISKDFVTAVNTAGGEASILRLPQAGLKGNTHFPFSDLNNQNVAEMLSQFMKNYDLDKRGEKTKP